MEINSWLSKGLYLPKIIRDFHDQKYIFRLVDEVVDKRKEAGGSHQYLYRDMPNWIAGQIYVIDFFLWVMAHYGYTLQKSRANLDWADLDTDIKELKQEFFDQLKKEHEV